MNSNLKTFRTIICLLMLCSIHHFAYAQQPLAQQAFTVFEQHCLDCHGEFGSYSDVLTIKQKNLIEDRAVIPGQPDASELYLRLLGDTGTGSQMPLGQEPLDSETIATIRRWIAAGAPDWEAIPKPKRRFITTEAMLKTIHTHVTSLTAFDRSFARYFTLTHLYNAGASDDNLRAYRNALAKLVNSLSWGSEVIKPKPIDREETIFYIDLRHYEWDIKSDKWYKIEQAYPYGVQLKSSTYTTLCQETDCELPFVRADWFIATASLPPLYHEILDLPKTDRELETRLEVDVAENIKNAPGVRVWRAGFNESGVSVNNRIVERHKSRYGAYWKSYDFAGNVGTQNIFAHPLNFTHDGGEIIFNLPNGLQAYYLSTATGERLDEAPINIVSDAGSRDPVVRNGLSCMGCHTEGMKTFEDQVRSVIEQSRNPTYDKAQALRLYAEKSEMESFVREDIARYRRAIAAAGGVFGGSEPIQQLVKQFEGPIDATHAAAEVGLETADFLQKIRENNALQNAGLLMLGVEKGTVKRDAWESEFGTAVSSLNLGKHTNRTLERISGVNSELPRNKKLNEGYFTVGSTKDEVVAVQGIPKSLSQWSFSYDGSSVGFENDRVIKWYSSPRNPLKVRIVPARDTPNKDYFTVGSTKDEVVAVQGTPNSLSQWSFGYGGSSVGFENDRVIKWYSSPRNPLKVRIVPARDTPNKDYFTVGSTKDEVVAVQGTPNSLSQWSFGYGGSSVGFENDRVIKWYSSPRNPLKVRIVPARDTPNKDYFTVGSTKDEVVAVQGTPNSLSQWSFGYGGSSVSFKNDRVIRWYSSPRNPLKAKMVPEN